MKMNFLLLLFFLSLFACNSNPTGEDGSPSVTLVGQWLWIRTGGGISGKEVITPKAGTRVVLTFLSNGQYFRLRNDTLQLLTQYIVKKPELFIR